MNNEKMMKLANQLDIFAKVFAGIFSAFGIVCVVFAFLLFLFEESVVADMSITLGIVKLYLTEKVNVDMQFMKYYMMVGLIMVAIFCFVIGYVVKLARSILSPMKEGRPFEEDIPETLRKIAWFVLGGGLLTQIVQMVEGSLISKAISLEEILVQDAISKIEYTYTVDFGFVMIFAVIMFLSYIFSYGVSLQRESDETL